MQCMATDPKQRPTFAEVERRIEAMLRELHLEENYVLNTP